MGAQVTIAANAIDKERLGYQAISLTHFADTAEPSIAAGSKVEVGGALYEFTGDETGTGWAGCTTPSIVYMYLVPAGASISWIYSDPAPTWDTAKQGWYNGNNRAFGLLYKLTGALYYSKTFIKSTQDFILNLSGFAFSDVLLSFGTGIFLIVDFGMVFNKTTYGLFPKIISAYIRACGYAIGGMSGATILNEIDGIQFDTEAAINPAAVLMIAKYDTTGCNSPFRGYAMCGYYQVSGNDIQGIQFDVELSFLTSALLSVTRAFGAGVNSLLKGYLMGGNTFSNEIDGIQFDTEAAINPAAALSVARRGCGGASSTVRGYAMGGTTGSYSAEIDGIQFDTEVAINPAAVLSVARDGVSALNSLLRGYAMGGLNATPYVTEIDGIQFDTEAAINPAAVLSLARYATAAVNSFMRGYAMGGLNASQTAEIDGIQFNTEAAINPAAVLSVARGGAAGVQSGMP